VTLILALLLDAALGEPRRLWESVAHPVRTTGRAIAWADDRFNNGNTRRRNGIILCIALCASAGAAGLVIAALPFGPLWEMLLVAILVAHRGLVDHVRAVSDALRLSVADGRLTVAAIVGRDTAAMDRSAVARAAIESAAENFSDGLVAPVFWYLIAGLPGILICKAVNTADSMIGHRSERYRDFGWAAAKLAVSHGPLAPFDVDMLREARALPPGTTVTGLWLYPPLWLGVVLPLAALPYFWAWIAFIGASFVMFALAVRIPARTVPGARLLCLSSLPVLNIMALGQNSLIFAALFILALEALRRDRAVVAGLAIAALSIKPQLGLVFPILLIFGGYWRTFVWAAIFTLLLVASSILWPGLEYWPAMIDSMKDMTARIAESDLHRIMITPYGAAATAGIGHDMALTIQAACSIVAAGVLAWVWTRPWGFDHKTAATAFIVLLLTPYAHYYELIFAIIGCLYAARAGVVKNARMVALFILIWISPLIGQALMPWPGFLFGAPMIIAALAGLLFIEGSRRPAGATI